MIVKKPGLRIIKTGIALFISMLLSRLRPGDGLSFYSGIAAVICMETDVMSTYTKGINRVKGTLIGGIFGLIYLLLLDEIITNEFLNLVLLSIFVTVLIWLLASFKLNGAIAIASVVFLSVTINHADDKSPLFFALSRVIDTLIGVFTAIFVNGIGFKYREKKIYKNNKAE
ncbi:MAG: aromatic acid exporter family protein [Anaerococcus sp.]|nr:aromatic acid exporter family protein [Anaerococcus sp.]